MLSSRYHHVFLCHAPFLNRSLRLNRTPTEIPGILGLLLLLFVLPPQRVPYLLLCVCVCGPRPRLLLPQQNGAQRVVGQYTNTGSGVVEFTGGEQRECSARPDVLLPPCRVAATARCWRKLGAGRHPCEPGATPSRLRCRAPAAPPTWCLSAPPTHSGRQGITTTTTLSHPPTPGTHAHRDRTFVPPPPSSHCCCRRRRRWAWVLPLPSPPTFVVLHHASLPVGWGWQHSGRPSSQDA